MVGPDLLGLARCAPDSESPASSNTNNNLNKNKKVTFPTVNKKSTDIKNLQDTNPTHTLARGLLRLAGAHVVTRK